MACKMKFRKETCFRNSFKIFCIVCVLCMVGYWFYKFDVEDQDIGIVDYKAFKDESQIKFPVASLCFWDPFIRKQLAEMNSNLDLARYLEYLQGEYFEKQFEKVDYSNITLDLDDYFKYTYMGLRNGTELEGSEISSFSHEMNFNGFTEWGYFYKCFQLTFDISDPGTVKRSFAVYNKQQLLRDLSEGTMEMDEIDLYIHYPGQFLLAPKDPYTFSISSNNQSLFIVIDDVEIIRSRNSRTRKCATYDSAFTFDNMVREKHITEEGCILPYFSSFKDFPRCNTSEKIKEACFAYQNARTRHYPISCLRLSKISYSLEPGWDIVDDLGYDYGDWVLTIVYPQYFRIITLRKEVDIHSLIGNVGGYVGLFLGK